MVGLFTRMELDGVLVVTSDVSLYSISSEQRGGCRHNELHSREGEERRRLSNEDQQAASERLQRWRCYEQDGAYRQDRGDHQRPSGQSEKVRVRQLDD